MYENEFIELCQKKHQNKQKTKQNKNKNQTNKKQTKKRKNKKNKTPKNSFSHRPLHQLEHIINHVNFM